jgi:hypothetical protein
MFGFINLGRLTFIFYRLFMVLCSTLFSVDTTVSIAAVISRGSQNRQPQKSFHMKTFCGLHGGNL